MFLPKRAQFGSDSSMLFYYLYTTKTIIPQPSASLNLSGEIKIIIYDQRWSNMVFICCTGYLSLQPNFMFSSKQNSDLTAVCETIAYTVDIKLTKDPFPTADFLCEAFAEISIKLVLIYTCKLSEYRPKPVPINKCYLWIFPNNHIFEEHDCSFFLSAFAPSPYLLIFRNWQYVWVFITPVLKVI